MYFRYADRYTKESTINPKNFLKKEPSLTTPKPCDQESKIEGKRAYSGYMKLIPTRKYITWFDVKQNETKVAT